jgi:hypothetical protein
LFEKPSFCDYPVKIIPSIIKWNLSKMENGKWNLSKMENGKWKIKNENQK